MGDDIDIGVDFHAKTSPAVAVQICREVEGLNLMFVEEPCPPENVKAMKRISGIETPILVMGREDDHLQGIFRVTYELLVEAGKQADWVSWDHDLHGYIYPIRGADGEYEVNEVADASITDVIRWLDEHM